MGPRSTSKPFLSFPTTLLTDAPGALFAFQADVIERLLKLDHPALFIEMRLGKTYVTIDFLQKRRAKKVLLIAPLSVLLNWAKVLKDKGISSVLLRDGQPVVKAQWHLTNFEQILVQPSLSSMEWDAVVIDESTRIKNPKAKSTIAICGGFDHAGTRMILSGAPAPENISDYFSQFCFLRGEFMGFSNFYRWRHVHFLPGRFDWVPKPGTAIAVKKYVHDNSVTITRAQLKMAPQKVYQTRCVVMTAKQEKVYRQVLKSWQCGTEMATQWQLVVENWLAQIAGGIFPGNNECVSTQKIYELLELLDNELEGQQVVVFYRFNREIRLTSNKLTEFDIDHGVITGDTPMEEREQIRQKFQKGNLKVVLLQVKVAKLGLDFSAADTAVYYSNGDSLEDRIQSEDRIFHLSKKGKPLLYIDLVTEGSVDIPRLEGLRDKKINSRWLMTQVFDFEKKGKNS